MSILSKWAELEQGHRDYLLRRLEDLKWEARESELEPIYQAAIDALEAAQPTLQDVFRKKLRGPVET